MKIGLQYSEIVKIESDDCAYITFMGRCAATCPSNSLNFFKVCYF